MSATAILATAARPAAAGRPTADTPRGLVSSFLGAPLPSKGDAALGALSWALPCARRAHAKHARRG
jgi:hypothetical protein